jgi:PncC family amidohydrolase
LQELCLRLGLTVATAESCTGGLVASAITDVGGSSGYFRGGLVVYSNDAKIALLGVAQEMLQTHGAVSAQVARAMALGARARLSADLAVAVTGVAGPGGGSASKPIGLTYVAVADAAGVDVRRLVWTGDRLSNKQSSARAALELLLQRASAGSGSAGSAPAEGGGAE